MGAIRFAIGGDGQLLRLNDLLDVTISGVLDQQLLIYDASIGQWINESGYLDMLSDTDITEPTISGQLLIVNESGIWINESGSLRLMSDVLFVEPVLSGQFLIYDGSGYWVNESGYLANIADVMVTDPLSGQFLIFDGSGLWVNQSGALMLMQDVLFSDPITSGQFLIYDGSGHWINDSGSLLNLEDVLLSDSISGQLLIYNGSGYWVNESGSLSIMSDVRFSDIIESGQFLIYDGEVWVNESGQLRNLSDVHLSDPVESGQLLIANENGEWVSASGELELMSDVVFLDPIGSGDLLIADDSGIWHNIMGSSVYALKEHDHTGYVHITGDTMTGPLNINVDDVVTNPAASFESYVPFTIYPQKYTFGSAKASRAIGRLFDFTADDSLVDPSYAYGYVTGGRINLTATNAGLSWYTTRSIVGLELSQGNRRDDEYYGIKVSVGAASGTDSSNSQIGVAASVTGGNSQTSIGMIGLAGASFDASNDSATGDAKGFVGYGYLSHASATGKAIGVLSKMYAPSASAKEYAFYALPSIPVSNKTYGLYAPSILNHVGQTWITATTDVAASNPATHLAVDGSKEQLYVGDDVEVDGIIWADDPGSGIVVNNGGNIYVGLATVTDQNPPEGISIGTYQSTNPGAPYGKLHIRDYKYTLKYTDPEFATIYPSGEIDTVYLQRYSVYNDISYVIGPTIGFGFPGGYNTYDRAASIGSYKLGYNIAGFGVFVRDTSFAATGKMQPAFGVVNRGSGPKFSIGKTTMDPYYNFEVWNSGYLDIDFNTTGKYDTRINFKQTNTLVGKITYGAYYGKMDFELDYIGFPGIHQEGFHFISPSGTILYLDSSTKDATFGGAVNFNVSAGKYASWTGAGYIQNNIETRFYEQVSFYSHTAYFWNGIDATYSGTTTATHHLTAYDLSTTSNATIGQILTIGSKLQHNGTGVGFYGTSAISKPTVSGSRADPSGALYDLLNELANLGLIYNSTTA